jgi:hypothetical protein
MTDVPNISPIITNTLGGLIIAWVMVLFVRELVKFIQAFKDAGMPKNGQVLDMFTRSVPFNLHAQQQNDLLLCVKETQKFIIELRPILTRLAEAIEHQTEVWDAICSQTDRRSTPR